MVYVSENENLKPKSTKLP